MVNISFAGEHLDSTKKGLEDNPEIFIQEASTPLQTLNTDVKVTKNERDGTINLQQVVHDTS